MSIPRRAIKGHSQKNDDTPAQSATDNSNNDLCSFCQHTPAAVAVQLPHPRFPKRKRVIRHLCVKHFYTTPAARTVSMNSGPQQPQSQQSSSNNPTKDAVEILDATEFDRQLKAVQELFAEAFVQLQQEISEEAARAFTAQQNDPLAILHDLHKKKNTRPRPTSINKKEGAADAGGFLRNVTIPERLKRTQQPQTQSPMGRMTATTTTTDQTKRRKKSRKSIWSEVRDDTTRGSTAHQVAVAQRAHQTSRNVAHDTNGDIGNLHESAVACKSCGSTQVRTVGSNASRNHDLTKGETWGTKDRAEEVFHRYECQSCGLTWNEEA